MMHLKDLMPCILMLGLISMTEFICVFLYLSDRFWMFVMKSAGVSYIKHSCGLITDEMSMSVKAKPHFDIITQLTHTHTAQTRQLTHDVFKDAL